MAYGKITSKQKEILEFMKNEILSKGYPPAVREICEAVHLKSTSSVHSHLETLEKNGYIRRDPAKPRAAPYLAEFGFEIEPFGSDTLLVRAVPASLAHTKDLKSILERFASDLTSGSRVSFAEKCDRALFTVACKAALKAGIPNDAAHNEWVVEQLMQNPSLRFCPHGRPVMHALTRKEIEGYFDR